jgi:hypothetical protein
MNKSTNLKNHSINLGAFTMGLAFFKHKDLLSRYRRKPMYLSNNSFNNDLHYFLILNKHI